jgi:hypothetical protein
MTKHGRTIDTTTEQRPIGEWDNDYKEGSNEDEPGQHEGYKCDGTRKGGAVQRRYLYGTGDLGTLIIHHSCRQLVDSVGFLRESR